MQKLQQYRDHKYRTILKNTHFTYSINQFTAKIDILCPRICGIYKILNSAKGVKAIKLVRL